MYQLLLDLYHFWFNPTSWGLALYYTPMVVCLVGGLIEAAHYINRDFNRRSGDTGDKYYNPTVTLGTILWGIILSFIPVLNLIYTVFHYAGDIIKRIYNICHSVLTTPIVPDTAAHEQLRKDKNGK